MFDDYNENTGVNEQPAAGVEYDEYYEPVEHVEGQQEETDEQPRGEQTEQAEQTEEETPAETGEEEQPAAEVQQDKTEIAFAKRLAKEREKMQREFMEQYAPVLSLAEQEAMKYGMTPQQWAQAVQQNAERQYYQQMQEYGVDPRIIEQHPAVIKARQAMQQVSQKEQQLTAKEKFNMEAQEFFEMFPDVDAKSISPEVMQLREQRGLSLVDAYLRVNHKKMLEETRAKAEQQAIAGMRKKKQASTGSATGGGTTINSAWDLSDKDFDKLYERAMRGERIKF